MLRMEKPTHRLYHVREYETEDGKKKGKFTELGACWPNKDGKGFSLSVDVPAALIPGEKYLLREDNEPEASS